MKIRKVRICNIHSLAGCHELDFTKPPFVGAGLFVITGPTGAGKSTLLDAITLALYGKIARHDGHFKEVVSHGAPEAFALVEFEAKGKLLRSSWAVTRKTRGAHKGQLNDATRSIAIRESDGQWRTVAEKKKEADSLIHQYLGLTFEQFTRTAFLPQGAFTNFLRAKSSERAEILEGLTGTEIYGRLSMLCAQIKKEKEARVEKEKARLESIPLLNDEALHHIRERRASLKEAIASLAGQIQRLNKHIEQAKAREAALEAITQLEREIQSAATALEQVQTRRAPLVEQLATARKQLDRHLKRKPELERRWDDMQAHDRKISEKDKRLRERAAQIQQLAKKRRELETEIEEIKRKIDALEQARKSLQDWMTQRPYLDKLKTELSALKTDWNRTQTIEKQIQALHAEAQSLRRALEKERALIAQLEAEGKSLKEEETAHLRACEELHIRPDDLAREVAHCQKRYTDLHEEVSLLKATIQKLHTLHSLSEKKQSLEAQAQKTRTALRALQRRLEVHRREIPELRASIKEAERQRDLELLAQDFAKHRPLLKEGEPCPLCGAVHHPALRGKAIEARVGKAEQKLQELKTRLSQKEAQIVEWEKQRERLEQELHFCETQLSDCEKQSSELTTALQQSAYAELAECPPEKCADKLSRLEARMQKTYRTLQKIQHLSSRRNEWKERYLAHKDKLTAAQTNAAHLQDRAKHIQERIDELQAEKNALLCAIRERLASAALRADPSPALWHQLEEELKTLDAKYEKLQKIKQEFSANKAALEEKVQQLEACVCAFLQDEKILEKEKISLEKEIALRAERFGKSTAAEERAAWEAQMHHYRERIDVLHEQIGELEARHKELQGMLKEKQSQRAAMAAKAAQLQRALGSAPSEGTAVASMAKRWQQQKDELERQRDALLQESGQLEQQLAAHRQAEIEAASIRERLQAHTREAARWQALSELIGSHDGKRFRTLAQALTLRQLITLANRQLSQMLQGRYRLHTEVDTKKKTVELELFIIDRFQADAMRPVQTLSGGESFLVSLALALGLSEMAGGQIEIESLFIDEGFGTLDDKNLDTAMEVLEGLRSSGRLVGIISHVKELKARIPVQVEIVPQGSGLSAMRISGGQPQAAP